MAWNKYGICVAVCTIVLLLFTACKVIQKIFFIILILHIWIFFEVLEILEEF